MWLLPLSRIKSSEHSAVWGPYSPAWGLLVMRAHDSSLYYQLPSGSHEPAGHLTPRPALATPQTHSQQSPHLLHLSTGGVHQQHQLQRLFWKR